MDVNERNKEWKGKCECIIGGIKVQQCEKLKGYKCQLSPATLQGRETARR